MLGTPRRPVHPVGHALRGFLGMACNLTVGTMHDDGVSDTAWPEFGEWAAAARPRLRRLAFLLSGDWHLAEDLTQEALVRLHTVWRRVSATGTPDGYARKVLVNAFRAHARRPWRREHLTDALPESAAAGSVDHHDERQALTEALAQLGRSQRTILVLRYWEDMSVVDVADLLNLSTGTVKSQTARGLDRLRAALAPIHPPLPSGDPT